MMDDIYVKLKDVVHIVDLIMTDDSIKRKGKVIRKRLKELPGEDVEKVKHGEWLFDVRSFYRDTLSEDSELEVYIVASCSCCGERLENGNSGQVFSKTVYAPEGQEYGYKFDETFERTKALEEFKRRNYELKKRCPLCGAKMDKKEGSNNG